jgi:hypothetical protein
LDEATAAAEVALAPAWLAYELAELAAWTRAEETEALAFSYFSSAVSLDEVKSYTRQSGVSAYPLVQTHVENLGELLLGKLDTGRDSLPDGREDLLDLVLGLNVVDLQTDQRRGYYFIRIRRTHS